MAVIEIPTFGGETPLLNAKLLPVSGASAAYNVRLNDGILTPLRKSTETGFSAGATNHKTIFRFNGTWVSFANEVWAATGPVAQDRLYYTGVGAPKMLVGGTTYDLAVPTPAAAPSVAVTGSGSGDVQTRLYVYTWVTSLGEESMPCPATAAVNWQPGTTVTLSGFGAIPAGRAITKQRIYRSQTGSSGTYFYFIAERAAATTDFVDTVPVDGFQEVLPSSDWTPPPAGLSGLIQMPNGIMAAFVGPDLYFCEPYRPHAWPEKYVLTMPHSIVGLAAIGQVLIVMTTGQPYIVQGSHPDSMADAKIEAPFACINSRSIVNLGFGVAYAANEGLVLIRADGSVTLATAQSFSREQWLALAPRDIIAGQAGGVYSLFYEIIDEFGSAKSEMLMINVNAAQSVSRSTERADAVFYDLAEASLYFKRPGETAILKFDEPSRPRETLYWRSKEFMSVEPVSFGALLIDSSSNPDSAANQAEIDAIQAKNAILLANPLTSEIGGAAIDELPLGGDILTPVPTFDLFTANVYADDVIVRTVGTTGQVLRLPGGKKARKWQIDVSANVPVTQIIMASTVEELKGR